MKVNRIVNAYVEADVSAGLRWYRGQDEEAKAKAMESLVSEFHDFVRDHRSMDWIYLTVIKERKDVCSFCGSEWEVDDEGVPMCCQKAIDEHEQSISS
jgi:hypothetical protein